MIYLYELENLGEIEKVNKNPLSIKMTQKSFAPGLWAGTEGAIIGIKGTYYEITQVDLNSRILYLKLKNGQYTPKSGDEIDPHFY